MGALDLLQVLQLSRKLEHILICVHVSLVLEINTLLDEDSSHGNQVIIRAEVLI